MRVAAVVLVPIALWFALILILLMVPLPEPLPPPWASERNKIGAALTGVACLAYLAFLCVFLVGELDAAGRRLDDAVRPLALTARPQLPGARAYDGQVNGRAVTLAFLPAVALQRASVTASVSAKLPASISIGWTAPLAGCSNCPRVPMADDPLGPLVVVSADPEWTRGLLAREKVASLVLGLIADPDALGNRFVHLEPGKVWLQARPTDAGIARSGDWLRSLADLAEECEKPAPTPN